MFSVSFLGPSSSLKYQKRQKRSNEGYRKSQLLQIPSPTVLLNE